MIIFERFNSEIAQWIYAIANVLEDVGIKQTNTSSSTNGGPESFIFTVVLM